MSSMCNILLQVSGGSTNASTRFQYSKAFSEHQLALLVGQMFNEMFAIYIVDGGITEWKGLCCVKEEDSRPPGTYLY